MHVMAARSMFIVKILLVMVCYGMVNTHDLSLEVRGLAGSIKSPNYPNKYPKNITVTWTLIAGSQYSMDLNFTAFDIEKVKDCRYDFVQVRNSLNDSWSTVEKYCNSKKPGLLTSVRGWAQIGLTTDSDKEFTGFKLEWNAYERTQNHSNSTMYPRSSIQIKSTPVCSEHTKTLLISKFRTITVSSCMKESISKAYVSNKEHLPNSKGPTSCSCSFKSCIMNSTRMQSEKILVSSHPYSQLSEQPTIDVITRSRSMLFTNINTQSAHTVSQARISTLKSRTTKSIQGNKTDELRCNTSALSIAFYTLTGIFALVSLIVGILLCCRMRENRIRVIGAAGEKQHFSVEKQQSELAMQCIRGDPSLTTEQYSIFDSPRFENKEALTLTAQTSIESSYNEEFSKDEKGRINSGFAKDMQSKISNNYKNRSQSIEVQSVY